MYSDAYKAACPVTIIHTYIDIILSAHVFLFPFSFRLQRPCGWKAHPFRVSVGLKNVSHFSATRQPLRNSTFYCVSVCVCDGTCAHGVKDSFAILFASKPKNKKKKAVGECNNFYCEKCASGFDRHAGATIMLLCRNK